MQRGKSAMQRAIGVLRWGGFIFLEHKATSLVLLEVGSVCLVSLFSLLFWV